jgi:hypothetical protein
VRPVAGVLRTFDHAIAATESPERCSPFGPVRVWLTSLFSTGFQSVSELSAIRPIQSHLGTKRRHLQLKRSFVHICGGRLLPMLGILRNEPPRFRRLFCVSAIGVEFASESTADGTRESRRWQRSKFMQFHPLRM